MTMADRSGLGLAFGVLMGACSAHLPPAQTVVQRAPGGEAAHHGGHHVAGLPAGPLSEMQLVLRPLAHGNTGADRDARICAQAQTLRDRVAAVVAAPVPAEAQTSAEAWRSGTARLAREGDALVATCTIDTRAGVSERLEALHVAFHELTEDL
jgi:hypothetical protein